MQCVLVVFQIIYVINKLYIITAASPEVSRSYATFALFLFPHLSLSLSLSLSLFSLSSPTFLLQGFESRGTEVANRLAAWRNLLDSISHIGLVPVPRWDRESFILEWAGVGWFDCLKIHSDYFSRSLKHHFCIHMALEELSDHTTGCRWRRSFYILVRSKKYENVQIVRFCIIESPIWRL